jgi:hypothetical protein
MQCLAEGDLVLGVRAVLGAVASEDFNTMAVTVLCVVGFFRCSTTNCPEAFHGH